jgi:hypothetical protein
MKWENTLVQVVEVSKYSLCTNVVFGYACRVGKFLLEWFGDVSN